jgi:DNA-binding transcriptional ArsR family regulator
VTPRSDNRAEKPDNDGWTATGTPRSTGDIVDIVDIAVAEHVAHPTRGRLLRRLKQPQSVAELAEWLDVPVTRLYHHIKLLESDELIRVVSTRQVGAATERRYQATAQAYRLPKTLIAETEPAQLGQLLGSVFDLAKLDFVEFVERGGMATPSVDQHVTLSLSHMQLSPSRQSELVDALVELVREYTDDPLTDETEPFAMFVAAFPPDDEA